MRRILVSLFALLIVLLPPAFGKDDPRQRVLDASHSTRINDVDMKPWHLKVNFHLNERSGKPEAGTFEEWWAGLTTWKLRIESPSYTGTVIENRGVDFRTEGVGPTPLLIRGIEQDIVYPMPMVEDLSGMVARMSHHRLDKTTLDCIQLYDPRFETAIPLPFATYCFDQGGGALRAIINPNSSIIVRDRVGLFAEHAPALSIRRVEGKAVTASAEVVDLSPMQPDDTMFTPSPDMKKVTDMHAIRVTRAP